MALVLDATLSGENSNSYCTVEEADAIMEMNFHKGSVWAVLTVDDKNKLLASATSVLELKDYDGTKSLASQLLAWPRNGVSVGGVVSGVIPHKIKVAQVMLAAHIQSTDIFAKSETDGFDKIKVGPIELGIRGGDTSMIPDYIMAFVRPFLANSGEGSRIIGVKR